MGDNLKSKAVKGIGWGFADNVLSTGLMAVVNLLLARLLSPAEFGLVGITSIFITFSTSLVDSGFTAALTRSRSVGKEDLDTVFHFNMVVSVFLYGLLYFSAPAVASFFAQPVLSGMLRILGLVLLLSAAGIVQKAILIRKIDFRTQAMVSVVSSAVSGILGIGMALNGYGVWSLVAMQISRVGISSVMLWYFSSWLPSFSFSFRSLSRMYAFGGRLVLSSIISLVWTEIYAFVIGKMYHPSVLGQYSRADKFRNMVTQNVSLVMQRVSFPVLASIQDEKERQLRAFRKVMKTTVLISFTGVLGLAAVSEAAVVLLVGDQWLPAVHYLRIMCLSGMFIPLVMCSANILNANGHSGMTLWLEIMKTALATVPVLAGLRYGMDALLWSMIPVNFVAYLVHAACISRKMGYGLAAQLKDILPVFAVSAVMALLAYSVTVLEMSLWVELPVQLSVGAATVVLMYEYVFRLEEYHDVRNALLDFIRSACEKMRKV